MSNNIFTTLMTYPAVIFTILLVVVLIYWLFVILGALDMDVFSIESDAENDGDGFGQWLGMADAPMTVVLSLWILLGWFFAMPSTHYLLPLFSGMVLQLLAGTVILLISVGMALYLTGWLVKPLRPLFTDHEIRAQQRLVGKLCTITTQRVDEQFGQAEFNDGGAGLILSVRASVPNLLRKNSRALILSYDKESHVYHITSYDEINY